MAKTTANGDGILDLATANHYTASVSTLLGDGTGKFRTHLNYRAASGMAVADFNGDGKLDLAVGNQFVDSISVFLQRPQWHTEARSLQTTESLVPKTLQI